MSNEKTILEQKYKQLFEQLNTEQQRAVTTIYGPVMVLAGPGTGKTQILAMRIAYLLSSDAQVNANEILCMTFTDAGRIAMRKRLNEIIGTELSSQIAIHTFHSFCNEILQANLPLFDKDILEAASELEKLEIVKLVLDELPNTHIFKNPKNPYANAKSLLQFFSEMKKENWTPTFMLSKLDEYQNEIMPTNVDFFYKTNTKYGNVGEKKPSFAEELERVAKARAAVHLFDNYKTKMDTANRYDYDDMIQWIINAFDTNPEMLMRYAEKYQYIMVDEYQDTNGSQNELIRQLCSLTDEPNLFVVGDDDQSIYRFQGANLENMEELKNRYQNIEKITLEINYRSFEQILQQAEMLINHNTKRLKDDGKPLLAHHQKGKQAPTLLGLQTQREEMVYIATQIQQLLQNGVEPKEIAVLYYKNADCLELAKYLQFLQIDYYTRSRYNLVEMPLSSKILELLQYINLESQIPFSGDLLLFKILHFHFFEIDAMDIAIANLQSKKAAIKKEIESYSFREYLQSWAKTKNPSLFIHTPQEKIVQLFTNLEKLIIENANASLLPFFLQVLKTCKIYEYILTQPNKIELIDELTALIYFVKEQAHLQPNITLAQFLDLLNTMQENELPIPYYKTMGKEDAVQLLTIHSCKGLEFEHVFVASCVAKKWEKKGGGNFGIKIPDNVYNEQYKYNLNNTKENKDVKNTEKLEELRRLMYVAATRAKNELTFTYFIKDEKDKEVEVSALLYELFTEEKAIENARNRAVQNNIVSKEMLVHFEPIYLLSQTEPNVPLIEKEFIDAQLSNFTMNVSALNNYLKCPVHFYYNNILKVPGGISEASSFGTAIHYALEHFMTAQNWIDEQLPNVEFLLSKFAKSMYAQREKFTTGGYSRLLEYGKEILVKLYAEKMQHWHKIVKIEHKVENVKWNGIPIKGFMDKLEFTGNQVNVVDYKTGKFDSVYAKDNCKTPAEDKKKGIGGNYWRQAAFYKLLLDSDKTKNWAVATSEFLYVEPTKPEGVFESKIFAITQDDVDTVCQQILQTWENIQAHNFSKGCNEPTCEWCTFVKENKITVCPE